MSQKEAKKGYFEYPLSISLGFAKEGSPTSWPRPSDLNQYAWTIDFDRRVYILSRAE
jgi:hypothetical protein